MKVRISLIDRFVYLLACIGSFGTVYLFRVIITEGVKHALIDDKQENI